MSFAGHRSRHNQGNERIHTPIFSLAQRVIEDVTGADQREMGKGMWKIPLCFSGRTDLLRVQPKMVGIGEHLLKVVPCLLQPSRPGQGLDKPETADAKRPLPSFEAIICRLIDAIAIDLWRMRQFPLNAVQGAEHARIRRG